MINRTSSRFAGYLDPTVSGGPPLWLDIAKCSQFISFSASQPLIGPMAFFSASVYNFSANHSISGFQSRPLRVLTSQQNRGGAALLVHSPIPARILNVLETIHHRSIVARKHDWRKQKKTPRTTTNRTNRRPTRCSITTAKRNRQRHTPEHNGMRRAQRTGHPKHPSQRFCHTSVESKVSALPGVSLTRTWRSPFPSRPSPRPPPPPLEISSSSPIPSSASAELPVITTPYRMTGGSHVLSSHATTCVRCVRVCVCMTLAAQKSETNHWRANQ